MSDPIYPPPPNVPPPGGAYPSGPTGSGQPNGTMILVLGILSIVCLPILGPFAWIMGNNALAQINSGAGDPSQASNVNVGRICGIIGTVLLILGVLYGIFMGVIIATAGHSHPQTYSTP